MPNILEKLPKDVRDMIHAGTYTLYESEDKQWYVLATKSMYFILDSDGAVIGQQSIEPNLDNYHQVFTLSREDKMNALVRQTLSPIEELREYYGPLCQETLEKVTGTNTPLLYRLVGSSEMTNVDLSTAAELLGGTEDEDAIPVLLNLLHHHSPIVREGAVYGLSNFLDRPTVKAEIQKRTHSETEPSPGVRRAAEELIKAGFIEYHKTLL